MKTKKVELIVENTCHGCPFCKYDSYYGMSIDSGWDCENVNAKQGRIVDDHELKTHYDKLEQIKKQNMTMFPYTGKIPKDPMSIPDWCPLPDYEKQ